MRGTMTSGNASSASRCAAGGEIMQAGKRACGAVDAGGQGGEASKGRRGAKNAGGQAWINNVSMG